MTIHYQDDTVTLHHGDCLDVLRSLPDAGVDAVVTDPPYGIRFMGQGWDGADIEARVARGRETSPMPEGVGGPHGGYRSLAAEAGRYDQSLTANQAFQQWCTDWATECLRVLKPGGHLLSFGGSRTWHRLAAAVEDAGFEIRDSIAWLYGSGFPKSMDVAKAIDKRPGVERHSEFAAELRAAMAAKGYTNTFDVAEAVTGRRTGAVANWQKFQWPDARWWPALRDLLDMDAAKWDHVIAEAERIVSGVHTTGLATGTSGVGASGEGKQRRDFAATEAARRWQGWGTALKPSFEPIVVARKPLAGTVAANVLAHGTGALNIDACRTSTSDDTGRTRNTALGMMNDDGWTPQRQESEGNPAGRWPANVVLDGDQADDLDAQTGLTRFRVGKPRGASSGDGWGMTATGAEYDDQGGASRFFPVFRYEAKAPTSERPRVDGVAHPTVKPIALMQWLVRLVTPPGGTVLEPFAGSGTTVEACVLEGFRCVAIEREADYLPLIEHRLHRRDVTAPAAFEVAPGAVQDGFDFGEATA